jgi:DNA-binding response OmpR family regulator
MNAKILIIEDDPDIAALEKDFLEMSGFETEIEHDGARGAERALAGDFALILLDLMLPGKDGMTICREIRAKIDIPILMVTARIEDIDKVRGLGLGADDYITKPFSPTELVARVKSHIARFQRLTRNAAAAQNKNEIDLGWLSINNGTHRVFVDGKEITLTGKEYELLYFFVCNADIVFSKEHLYDKIWGEDMYGDMKTVTVHIKRLREKIETAGAKPQSAAEHEAQTSPPAHIQTVWGVGYRFTA